MSTQPNSKPKRPASAPVIREPSCQVGASGVNRLLFIPAALLSAVVNGALLFGLMLLPNPNAASARNKTQLEKDGEQQETVVQADPVVEPEVAKDPLVIDEIDPAATEPDTKINYNNERKDDISVPGVVNADEPVGVLNGSKDALPTNLPAPPGIGIGQGGPLESSIPGTGGPTVGMAGGYGLRGLPLAGTFYGRSGATREKALREGGGTKETEAAVARGLKWIVRQQIQDGARRGCWPLDAGRFKDRGDPNDTAGTAFGLLPLLGAGYTHKKSKNGKENPFDKPILHGLMFLLRRQDKKTGDLGGGMYAHSLATIALCEAYGLSQDPWLKRPAQLAVDYLVKAQHSAGGWRYSPGERGDTSVTGWVVMALKSAQMAGLSVRESTMTKAIAYINSCCSANEGYGYVGPSPTPTMSAVGLLCREYLQNWGSQNLRMIKGVENHIEKNMPSKAVKNIYYYYYATQVLHHFGTDSWKRWNERMSKVLLETQEMTSGGGSDVVGSWSSVGQFHGGPGGRLMTTSLSILTLEVYYRHLPLYYRDMGEKRATLN
jgi:hypothetical protein